MNERDEITEQTVEQLEEMRRKLWREPDPARDNVDHLLDPRYVAMKRKLAAVSSKSEFATKEDGTHMNERDEIVEAIERALRYEISPVIVLNRLLTLPE